MYLFFFFNDTATTEIYTLSLHDALPIYPLTPQTLDDVSTAVLANKIVITGGLYPGQSTNATSALIAERSEEHTSELQSRQYLVCRLLLEKKKNTTRQISSHITFILFITF